MNLALSIELNQKLSALLNSSKQSKEESLREMILVYEDYLNLKEEMGSWDKLADESLFNFEKSLNK